LVFEGGEERLLGVFCCRRGGGGGGGGLEVERLIVEGVSVDLL
jgi:hypothetical protein